jgi:hypothetical protein
MQVIIYTTEKGNVAVCVPTGELSIEEVLERDCPEGSIIIDDSELPTDNEFFDAWELIDNKVIVNETKKQAIIDAKQLEVDAKESALSKLTALGLTADEVKALLGVA